MIANAEVREKDGRSFGLQRSLTTKGLWNGQILKVRVKLNYACRNLPGP